MAADEGELTLMTEQEQEARTIGQHDGVMHVVRHTVKALIAAIDDQPDFDPPQDPSDIEVRVIELLQNVLDEIEAEDEFTSR